MSQRKRSAKQIREIRNMFLSVLIGRNTAYSAFSSSRYNAALWQDLQSLGGMVGEW